MHARNSFKDKKLFEAYLDKSPIPIEESNSYFMFSKQC